MTYFRLLLTFLIAATSAATANETAVAARWEFPVRFTQDTRDKPFSGRVYLIFTRRDREPRLGPNWFQPEQFLSLEVDGWVPDTPLLISSDQSQPAEVAGNLLAHPEVFENLDLTGYRVQAVARFNPWQREIGTGAGNAYSQTGVVQAEGRQPELVIGSIVPEEDFQETRWTKLFRIRSTLLSDFYGRDIYQRAAVTLPESYETSPDRQYPTIFEIPGFSGDHRYHANRQPPFESGDDAVEFIRVMLDPSCPLGHHVFADSANNGPRGQALIEEFLPAFDRKFRSIPEPTAKFLTGHSSGGWSSLWLQVTYPEHFGGVWSTAPDPVDFRDFQRINLYEDGENMYVDEQGNPRPLARVRGEVRLWYKNFAHMEWTLGHGGQLHSFEAAFSPRRADGQPKRAWDWRTGEVFTEVTKTWEKYDIRLILERNWEELEPKLQGKLHVFMGDQDTFYLEGATVLLKQSLEKLGSDAQIKIISGRDHMNLLTPALRKRIRTDMVKTFRQHHAE